MDSGVNSGESKEHSITGHSQWGQHSGFELFMSNQIEGAFKQVAANNQVTTYPLHVDAFDKQDWIHTFEMLKECIYDPFIDKNALINHLQKSNPHLQ